MSKPSPRSGELVGEHVRIYTRGATWYANYQFDGKQRRVSLKTKSKKQARQMAIRLETKLQDGTYSRPKTAPSITSVTDGYLAYLRTERKAAKTIKTRRALAALLQRRIHDAPVRCW